MLEYKRQHWAVENRLHYVLDETFGEDKSTIKKGKNTMSTLRKCSYNIVRLLQMKDQKGREYVPDIIDDICDNLEIDLELEPRLGLEPRTPSLPWGALPLSYRGTKSIVANSGQYSKCLTKRRDALT